MLVPSRCKYKTIIFDFDGVLVDSVDIKGQVFCKMYEQHGEEIAQAVYRYHMANGGVTRNEKFKHFSRIFFNKELEAESLGQMCHEFSELVTQKVVNAPFIKGAKEFLEHNYKSIRFHVASATPTDELLEIMQKKNMCHYFKSIKGGPANKTNNIKDIINEYRNNSFEVLMVGDAKTDFDGAQNNGIDFMGVGNDSYLKNNCPYMVEDLTQLEEHLNGC
jgi:phosphoglycolate phosphatase-like HAD superfamily hydrolase